MKSSLPPASFKFNYHQEQADNVFITIIITITKDEHGGDCVQQPHGDIFCSLLSFYNIYIQYIYIYTHMDWQDNGAGSCGGRGGG